MPNMKRFAAFLPTTVIASVILLTSCSSAPRGSETTPVETVITDVTVVNIQDGSVLPHRAVVLKDGKIAQIGAANTISASAAAQQVDGSGKFLVPGFLDMHTHALGIAERQPGVWPLMLANGITGIREMSGSPLQIARAHELNKESAAGRVDAPEILAIPGIIFGGQVPTAAAAVQFVQQQKDAGADFFKVAAGGREAILAILEATRQLNMPVAGHLVPGVSATESSNLGWHAIEHLGAGWGMLLDCSTDETAIRAMLAARPPKPGAPPPTYVVNPRVFDGAMTAPLYQRIHDTYSAPKCQTLAQVFAKNDTWQVPTLIRLRTQNFGNEPSYRNDPNLQYVDKTTRALWTQLGQDFDTKVPPAAAATLQQFYHIEQQVTKLMQQNGVKIMAGSDLGGIWIVPGFSLHQEFHELAAAGLSPLEVLQSTTRNGAQFLHKESTMGSVDIGKTADLVLLDANPIEASANLDRIAAVFLKGRYFSRMTLNSMLHTVTAANNAAPLQPLVSALDTSHRD